MTHTKKQERGRENHNKLRAFNVLINYANAERDERERALIHFGK
jgi:hypothetical protein